MKDCQHVAIIMDGNGRWAKAQGKPRSFGHMAGADNVRTIAIAASQAGVKVLTLYVFSTENWKRSNDEVSYLMSLPAIFFKKYMKEFLDRGYRIRLTGEIDALPKKTQAVLKEAEEESKDNTGLQLCLAVNYGSHREIVLAAEKIVQQVQQGTMSLPINEEAFAANLMNPDLPPVDLLIRTGGEMRISNYLLWQIAYAELEFVEKAWPDFTPEDFNQCLQEFEHRNRRFGGVTNE